MCARSGVSAVQEMNLDVRPELKKHPGAYAGWRLADMCREAPNSMRLSENCQQLVDCRAAQDIVQLADVLGHSSIETTRLYLMTSGAEHRRRLEQLGLVV